MSYNYTPANVGTVFMDYARMKLGDNQGASRALLADEEITAIAAAFPPQEALGQLAETCASIFARRAEETVDGDARTRYRDREKYYLSLADRLRREAVPPAIAGSGATRKFISQGNLSHPDLSDFYQD